MKKNTLKNFLSRTNELKKILIWDIIFVISLIVILGGSIILLIFLFSKLPSVLLTVQLASQYQNSTIPSSLEQSIYDSEKVISGFVGGVWAIIVFFFILLLFAYCLTQTPFWKKIHKKKYKEVFVTLFLATLTWYLPFVIISFIIFNSQGPYFIAKFILIAMGIFLVLGSWLPASVYGERSIARVYKNLFSFFYNNPLHVLEWILLSFIIIFIGLLINAMLVKIHWIIGLIFFFFLISSISYLSKVWISILVKEVKK